MRRSRRAASAVGVAVALVSLAFPAGALGSSLVVINGRGWGNGVGLSQWGAEGYARHGWTSTQILSHYYPHTTAGSMRDQSVRVLLADGESVVAIGSAKPFLLVDSTGRTVHIPAGSLRLTPRLRLGSTALVPPITLQAGAQPLTLDGASYRGSFLLVRAAGRLTVVNVLSVERYLRGVVPSEMPPRWSMAAYEAQAVAARSYALASLRPGMPFDLYPDNRSQVYGGIASERPETNLAVGATAGKVLTYDDRVIAAYYDSNSGGRTAAIQDVFAGQAPVPYLVSVADPFDRLAPYHRWRVAVTSAELARRFNVPVADVRISLNPSARVSSVRLLAGSKTRTLEAADFSSALGLRSTYFTVGIASLTSPTAPARPGIPFAMHGFLRGLGGVVLQKRAPSGAWVQVRHVVAQRNGRFVAKVRPTTTTSYRLAVDRVAGPPVTVRVTAAPRR